MNIYFDNIIFSILESGGISVVWQEHLNRVIYNNYNYKCLEFNHSEKNIFRNRMRIPAQNIIKKIYPIFKIQRYLNPKLEMKEPFIFHSSYYRTCNNPNTINITTVHDFTYEYFASGLKKVVHCRQKHDAIRKSDTIICISKNTKRDLLKFLPDINPSKIRVIYNGVSEDYIILDDVKDVELPYPSNSYCVFVGARDWYKRFDLAIDIIKETKLNLVIIGSELIDSEKQLLYSKLKGRYKYVGRLPNETLNKIYNGAFCLLYTSEYEGFGIPILEAQKAGCPVIAMNTSSIPEVIANRNLTFERKDIKKASSIVSDLENMRYRTEILQQGLITAEQFSWNKMHNEIMDVYESTYNKRV